MVVAVHPAPKASPSVAASDPAGSPSLDAEPDRPGLSAAAKASDAFGDWAQSGADPRVQFLASDRSWQGSSSVEVVHPAAVGRSPGSYLAQEFAVTQNAPLVLTFHVRAQDATAGAVVVQLGTTVVESVAIPAGTYDWREMSLKYHVPHGTTTLAVRIIAAGASNGVWIDAVAAQGYGSTGVVVQNAGFEDNSADLDIANTTLVFPVGTARVQLQTRRQGSGRATWTLVNDAGATVLHGSSTFQDSAARVKLASAPPGYYAFKVVARFGGETVRRSVDLAVVRPAPAAAAGEEPAFGVGVHLNGETAAQLQRLLSDLRAIGVRTVRTDAYWDSIEHVRGQYDFSSLDPAVAAMRAAGITPLLIPGYGNRLYDGGRTPSSAGGIAAYARFTAALAAHFPTADIDVYNEFDFRHNDGACGTTPACYVRLLAPTATAVHAGSHARVSSPSITGIGVNSDWLTGFLNAGGLAHTDVLSLHPYTQPAGPESLGPQLDALNAAVRRKAPGRTVPIWFTEIGWSTVPGWVTERAQAADVSRTAAVAATHGVSRVYLYDATDDSPRPLDLESNFGLFRVPSAFAPRTAIPKPAAAAEAVAARLLDGAKLVRTDAVSNSNLYSEAFTTRSGPVRMIWATAGDVELTVRGSGLRTVSDTGTESTDPARVLKLTATSSPVYVTGTVTSVER